MIEWIIGPILIDFTFFFFAKSRLICWLRPPYGLTQCLDVSRTLTYFSREFVVFNFYIDFYFILFLKISRER